MKLKPESILFINQHYYPDVAATAQNLTDLCEHLADEGRQVHVICSRGLYHNKSESLPAYEIVNDVYIHRVGGSSFGRKHHATRLMDYASFLFMAFIKMMMLRKFDVVCTLTTPPMLATLGTLLKVFKRSKHIIWSMDLHPDAEIAMGMLHEDYWLTDMLTRIHHFNHKKADAIVSLGNYMSKRIQQYGVDTDKITELNIWSNKNDISVEAKEDCIHKLPADFRNRFIIQYSGNLGLVHEFDTMLNVILALRDNEDIGFVFNGDGPRREEVVHFAKAHRLSNIAIMSYVPKHELSESMGKADIHWFSLRDEYVGMAVPGKSIGYMASGRPVLFIGPEYSDNSETIAAANCGFVIGFNETDRIIDLILKLKNNPDMRAQLGENGRRWFEKHAEATVVCQQWSEVLDALYEPQQVMAYA